jgi:hypothetical protein
MHAMQQGIHTITANVPKWVFNSSLEWNVAIDFPDLNAMFRRDKLDINLVTICPCKSTSIYDIQIYSIPYVLLLSS